MKLTISLNITLLLIAFDAFAVTLQEQQNNISEQNRLMQRQQNLERNLSRQKELIQIKKDQKEAESKWQEKDLSKENGKIVQDLSAVQCFRIREVEFLENSILSKFRQKKLTKKYLGKCLNLGQIFILNQKISNYLVESGYITTSSQIVPQGLQEGVLKIKIVESVIERIQFNQDSLSDRMQKITAFGFFQENEILNLKKIEQGLDQINRLPSNNAVVKIIPGESKLSSIVAIENKPENSVRINASYDNSGSRITGVRKETLSLTKDNLFKINDSLDIIRSANDFDQNRKDGGSNYFGANFSVPFSWYTLNFNYSKSGYFLQTGTIETFKSHGETLTKTINLNRVFLRNSRMKLAGDLSFVSRNVESFANDIKYYDLSRKSSIVKTSIASTFFFKGSTLFLKPSYERVINVLNSQKNNDNLSSESAHAEFKIFKFYGNYAKEFKIAETTATYNLIFDSQMSRHTLYGIDRFNVGGLYSVRGFRDGSISGDSGYNIKNELSFNLWRIIIPYLNEESDLKVPFWLNNFSIMPFYDYGFARIKGGGQSGRISGAGVKLGFSHKLLNASLTFSNVLSKSYLLDQYRRENSTIYFSVSSEFGFL